MRPLSNEPPHFLDYQVTVLLAVAASTLSMRWFQGHDLDVLLMDHRAWPGEPWRLFTSCLLHGGVLHLVFNLFWTWRFGAVLEPLFGRLAMLGVYVWLGLGSMGAQWAISSHAVGLSGIGYGLFGLTWALDRFHPGYRGLIDARTTQMFVVWFFFCIAASYAGVLPVANVAHGAGALFGGLFGLALAPRPDRRRLGVAGVVSASALVALGATVGRVHLNRSDAFAWELSYDAYQALRREDYPAAIELLERSVVINPDSHKAWNNLGVAYERTGRRGEALQAFQRSEEAEASPADAGAARGERELFRPFETLLGEETPLGEGAAQ